MKRVPKSHVPVADAVDSVAAVDAVQEESAIAGKRSKTGSLNGGCHHRDGTPCVFVQQTSAQTMEINQTTRLLPSHHRCVPFALTQPWEEGLEGYHGPVLQAPGLREVL